MNDEYYFNPQKVAVEYVWYVTMPDILDLLDRFEYSTERMIVRNGVWEIEDPTPIYCDNKKLPALPYIFEGIGFFYQSWTRLPDVVINTEKQKLYILDKAHIDDFDKFSEKNSVFICLEFNAILEDETLTWADILKGIKKKHKASVNGDM